MKSKGFAPIIILVLIALAVVGYFGYKNYWPKLQTSVVTSPTPIATDPVTKWKIYSGNFFSFEYPDNYTVKSTDDPEMIILDGNIGENIEETYIDWRAEAYSNITVDQEVAKMKKTDIIKSEKKITLGVDLTVTENGLLGGQFGVGTNDVRVLILDTKQNRLVKLTTSFSKDIPPENFNKILSTFQFTK